MISTWKHVSVVCGIVLITGAIACGGRGSDSGNPDPTGPDPSTPGTPTQPPVVASLEISPSPVSVTPGQAIALSATAKTSTGAVVSGRTIQWSSNATLTGTISSTGSVVGVSVGTAIVTATDQASGIKATLPVSVTAPSRPAASLLALGKDSVLQFDQYVQVITAGYIDTTSTGVDRRIGILHRSGAESNPSISRTNFPLIAGIAECPNGEAYGISNADGFSSEILWRIDLSTAIVTGVAVPSIAPDKLSSMTCDSSNSLLVTMNFGGIGLVSRVNRTNGATTDLGYSFDSYSGIAVSSTGAIFATEFDRNLGQLLVTISPADGSPIPVGSGQQRQVFLMNQLAFRGNRLLGLGASQLMEINTSTGAMAKVRNARVP